MVTSRIIATPNSNRALQVQAQGATSIGLYQIGTQQLAGLGHSLPNEVMKLPRPPSIRAWDFLSIALAVFGADRFISRHRSPDGWTRDISLTIELVEPEPWRSCVEKLESAIRFLSGDIWHLEFETGGLRPPVFLERPTDRDCVCLFSGGLDSLIGALDLSQMGRQPFLVSQAFPKEGVVQTALAKSIGLEDRRFEGRISERGKPPYEASSRTRSIIFFAYGALVASSINSNEVFVPENGLISINPPLTMRRIGSLSTRTTHPYFLSRLQDVFDFVGIDTKLVNPYAFLTKGEMLLQCKESAITQLAESSYSCGKGKRLNKHCGRCVPCLIRRAAFNKAGVGDNTKYAADSLAQHASYDDVLAARMAVAQLAYRNMERWASEAGPLPEDPKKRKDSVDVVRRGIEELGVFLEGIDWP